MRIENDTIIIDNPYIVDFFQRKGTPEFMKMCEDMLFMICTICDKNPENSTDEYLKNRLDIFTRDLMDTLVHKGIKADLTPETLSTLSSKFDHMSEKLDMSRMVDTVSRSEVMMNVVQGIKSSTEQLTSKIDSFATLRTTNRYKGEHGERKLQEVLEILLQPGDGYTITDTSSLAHNCDMVIRRVGFPDIRIESKAHGRDTGDSVKMCEVKRFESDLASLGTHGIMVSLYSGIVGKGSPVDMTIIPGTNKMAFYISNNNFDGDTIANIVKLIYKLDHITTSQNEENSITLSNETMSKIRNHLSDTSRRFEEIKASLKASLSILNEMSISALENLIMSRPPEKSILACDHCRMVFKNKSGLTQHKNKCKQAPTIDV